MESSGDCRIHLWLQFSLQFVFVGVFDFGCTLCLSVVAVNSACLCFEQIQNCCGSIRLHTSVTLTQNDILYMCLVSDVRH